MNRRIYTGIVVVIVCLTFGLLTGCSSSSKTYTVAAASGSTPQAQTVGEAFAVALGVNVTSNGSPASGVTVTFAPPSSGASCTPSATTATTDSSGNASVTCTANTTPGTYNVSASVSATASTSFALTNDAPSVFVFDVTGMELINSGPNFYAIAGAVAFDLSGNVLGGEQDYNDGNGLTSPGEPTTPDAINASTSSLVVDMTTGTATLTLDVSAVDPNVGNAGIETFALQFANASHAVIMEFDGAATSSGSFDLQSVGGGGGGGGVKSFAFTLSGTDPGYFPMALGGILTDSAGVIAGTVDVNDDGVATTGNTLAGTDNGVGDVYGRGTASISVNGGTAVSLAYYVAGPEVIRLIDVDTLDSMVGTAYGQGSGTFDSTALGTADVFGFGGNAWGELYSVAGNLVPTGSAGVAAGTFTGEADLDDENVSVVNAAALAGTYTIGTNGYGSLSITSANLENSTTWGVYATDPTLNLYDPNNTTTGQGGALVLELDGALVAGTGIITPQGTTAATDFNSNSYAFGAQDFNDLSTLTGYEFDLVGQAPFDTTLDLTGATGTIGDISGFFVAGTSEGYTGQAFVGTASGPDAAGRYTLPLAVGPVGTNTTATDFNVVLYEANGGFAFWIDTDAESCWLGSLEEQSGSSLRSAHFKKGTISKAQIKMNHAK